MIQDTSFVLDVLDGEMPHRKLPCGTIVETSVIAMSRSGGRWDASRVKSIHGTPPPGGTT